MKFDSDEFRRLYEALHAEHPSLTEYMAWVAVCQWESDMAKGSGKKVKKPKRPPIFHDQPDYKLERGAVVLTQQPTKSDPIVEEVAIEA
jgi:hypothetical protein